MKQKLSLDSYRFMAALLIVAIHIYPLTSMSENIDFVFSRIFARIAVPIFLMITGYFVLEKSLEDKKVLKKYTWKIAKIYMLSMLIYFPLNIYNHYFSNNNFLMILKDILWNGTFYHLWYFPALLLGIWITYYLLKIKNKPIKISSFLLLYLLGLLGDSYYGFTENIPVLHSFYTHLFQIFDYTRNGIFYVPIFLGIGYKVAKAKNTKESSIHLPFLFLLLMLVEGIILHHFDFQRHSSMYLFLIPVSYYLFQLLIETKEKSNKKLRNLATGMYIMHPWFIVVIRLFSKIIHLENVMVENSMIHYLLVVLATLCFLWVFDYVKQLLIKKHIDNRR